MRIISMSPTGKLTQNTFLADPVRVEAGLLVVVRCLAPSAGQCHDLLGAKRQFGLQRLRGA